MRIGTLVEEAQPGETIASVRLVVSCHDCGSPLMWGQGRAIAGSEGIAHVKCSACWHEFTISILVRPVKATAPKAPREHSWAIHGVTDTESGRSHPEFVPPDNGRRSA